MSTSISVANPNESASEKEIRELHSRMGNIEKEYGGFSNIPPVKTHEYWALRDRLQYLLLHRPPRTE